MMGEGIFLLLFNVVGQVGKCNIYLFRICSLNIYKSNCNAYFPTYVFCFLVTGSHVLTSEKLQRKYFHVQDKCIRSFVSH
jgi:hypothetical protein